MRALGHDNARLECRDSWHSPLLCTALMSHCVQTSACLPWLACPRVGHVWHQQRFDLAARGPAAVPSTLINLPHRVTRHVLQWLSRWGRR